jgi:hypothetical protein
MNQEFHNKMNSNKHKLRHACLLFHVVKYKRIDRDITYSCMYLYVFFIRIKMIN